VRLWCWWLLVLLVPVLLVLVLVLVVVLVVMMPVLGCRVASCELRVVKLKLAIVVWN
jgi:hypothetical protein